MKLKMGQKVMVHQLLERIVEPNDGLRHWVNTERMLIVNKLPRPAWVVGFRSLQQGHRVYYDQFTGEDYTYETPAFEESGPRIKVVLVAFSEYGECKRALPEFLEATEEEPRASTESERESWREWFRINNVKRDDKGRFV